MTDNIFVREEKQQEVAVNRVDFMGFQVQIFYFLSPLRLFLSWFFSFFSIVHTTSIVVASSAMKMQVNFWQDPGNKSQDSTGAVANWQEGKRDHK